jgi:hypothetical protein
MHDSLAHRSSLLSEQRRWPSAVELSEMEQRYVAALAVVRVGLSVDEVATAFGVTRQSIYRWMQPYENGGLEAARRALASATVCPVWGGPCLDGHRGATHPRDGVSLGRSSAVGDTVEPASALSIDQVGAPPDPGPPIILSPPAGDVNTP